MSITVFGTCRFHNVSNSTCLQNFISYNVQGCIYVILPGSPK